MSNIVIKAENISKLYRLGEVGTGSFARDLNRWWAKVKGKEDPYAKIGTVNDRTVKSDSEFAWALKDIDFEIKQGEVLGIIGRNGAGKSTLLKILSRTTAPTTGQLKVKGRIASLLEVGTGFHPDLSGRENIYLNGAILGMSKNEIDRKFDEIVAFSGVERYVDTPVKRYSSGMYVRLAFAVAAHLESEILIIDEVLAVGDSEFQKKCLGKMGDVASKEGRTVLFVSHNMAAINSICTSGLVLANGRTAFYGNVQEAVMFYQKNHSITKDSFKYSLEDTPLGNEHIKLLSLSVAPHDTKYQYLNTDSGVKFKIQFYNYRERINLDCTLEVKTVDDFIVFHQICEITLNKDSKEGLYEIEGYIPPRIFNSGSYKVKIIIGENQTYALYCGDDLVEFEIESTPTLMGQKMIPPPGVMRPDMNWIVTNR